MAEPINYTATGIVFCKATTANLAVANSLKGDGTITDIINPVTLEGGTIEISASNNTVTGTGTNFLANDVGKYLFYYDPTGEPVVAGRIQTVSSIGAATLTGNASATKSGVQFGFSNMIIGQSENILIRIPVVNNSASRILPNWTQYRQESSGQQSGWFNNTNNGSLNRISGVNAPTVPASPVNINYTIKPLYGWQVTKINIGEVYFTTTNAFPLFCWAEYNPYGDSGSMLPPNALYKLFASEAFNLNGIVVARNVLVREMETYGY